MAEKPSIDSIRSTAEKIEAFLSYLVTLWKTRSWSTILVLFDAFLLVCFNPASAGALLSLLPLENLKLPDFYTPVFWLVICALFISAFVLALLRRPVTTSKKGETSPVKGLLPFETYEQEVFSHLQRGSLISECLSSIINTNYEFGLLTGPAGSGKTSFIKAGLMGALASRDIGCVYVKFDENNPEKSFSYALRDQLEQAELEKNGIDKNTLPDLAKKIGFSEDKPLVLIFDQFEQIFLHDGYQKLETLFFKSFFKGLTEDIRKSIKVLIVLRRDFEHLFSRFYSVIDQNNMVYFHMKNFTPRAAAEIFRVIAEHEGIKYDPGFLKLLTSRWLADRSDGLICPVDIQITARTLLDSKPGQEKEFTALWFKQAGKSEGIYEQFINQVLSVRLGKGETRKDALKVLRALYQAQQKQNSQNVLFSDIAHNLPQMRKGKLRELLTSLATVYVRLICFTRIEGKLYYSLFNPRTGPVIEKIYLKDSNIRPSSRLVDRRVTEWIHSDFKGRYLLNWRELFKITFEKPDLSFGGHKEDKTRFIRKSRIKKALQAFFMVFLLSTGLLCFSFWSSKTGIRWRMHMRLTRLKNKIDDPELNRKIEELEILLGGDNKKNSPKQTDTGKNTALVPGTQDDRSGLSETGLIGDTINQAYQAIIHSALETMNNSDNPAEIEKMAHTAAFSIELLESNLQKAGFYIETAKALSGTNPDKAHLYALEAERNARLISGEYKKFFHLVKAAAILAPEFEKETYSKIKQLEEEIKKEITDPVIKLNLLTGITGVHALLVTDDLPLLVRELADLTISIFKKHEPGDKKQLYDHPGRVIKELAELDLTLCSYYIRSLDNSMDISGLYLTAAAQVDFEEALLLFKDISSPLDKALFFGAHEESIKMLESGEKEDMLSRIPFYLQGGSEIKQLPLSRADYLVPLYRLIYSNQSEEDTKAPALLNRIQELAGSLEDRTRASELLARMGEITRERENALIQLDMAWNTLLELSPAELPPGPVIHLIRTTGQIHSPKARIYFNKALSTARAIDTAEDRASLFLALTVFSKELVPFLTEGYIEQTAGYIEQVPLISTRVLLYSRLLEFMIDFQKSKKGKVSELVLEFLEVTRQLKEYDDSTTDREKLENIYREMLRVSNNLKTTDVDNELERLFQNKEAAGYHKNIEKVLNKTLDSLNKVKDGEEKNNLMCNLISIICPLDIVRASELAVSIKDPAYQLKSLIITTRHLARTKGMQAYSQITYLEDKEYTFFLHSELLLDIMQKDVNKAAGLVEEITNQHYQDFTFLRLLAGLENAQFRIIMNSIETVPAITKDVILIEIARGYARNKKIDKTISYIPLIGDSNKKDNFALETIPVVGEFNLEKSEQIAQNISNVWKRDKALSLIALSYAQNNRYDRAYSIIKKCATRKGEAHALAELLLFIEKNSLIKNGSLP